MERDGKNGELNSFSYEAYVGGKEHFCRITQQYEKYGVEQDGIIIAGVQYNDAWQQVSGEPRSREMVNCICDHIEAQYQ
jgi:hypothetical protein